METQGKTEENIINQDKKQTQPIELVSPKAGTTTSSPKEVQVHQLFSILHDTYTSRSFRSAKKNATLVRFYS